MSTIIPWRSHAQWLAERIDRLTATEVARLWRSAAEWAKVRAEKAGAERPAANAVMQWGIDREPALVRYAQTIDPLIVPNSDLWVSDDGPWAATPDGVAEVPGGRLVCEVKTGSERGLTDKWEQYMRQVQWQLFVCEADSCLFVWEIRDEDDMGFTAGRRDYMWVDRNEDQILELLDIAERFLAGDDATELDVLIAAVVDVKAEEEKIRARRTEAEDALRAHIGDRDFRHDGPFGRVSLTLPKPRVVLDSKRLQAERPDVFSEFMAETPAKSRRLSVTEAK